MPDRIFSKPFEITQFWVSEKLVATGSEGGGTEARLLRFCPEHVRDYQPHAGGEWFFEVTRSDDDSFLGDFLPRILPTRANIDALNRGARKGSQQLCAAEHQGPTETAVVDDDTLYGRLEPYLGPGPMDASYRPYQEALWHVLDADWGLGLPTPERLCADSIQIGYREGLPCAAAMVRSVQPILEFFFGNLRFVDQSLTQVDGRVYDVVRYVTEAGTGLTQRFDVTDVFGRRELHFAHFF